ncbi:MAG TPA: hypothetical protein VFQ61_16975, partial [Polyangiaceae bacterium]|nr:hypothetical protein [Polyangiaceae bacterium]
NPFTDSDARDGTWVISAYNAQTNQFEIFASAAGSAKRKLGCIQSQNTTVHAIGVGKGAAYISILRDEKASILKLPL